MAPRGFLAAAVVNILVLHHQAGSALAAAGTVTFLHTNDNHAHIEPMNKAGSDCPRVDWDNCFGGYARIKVRCSIFLESNLTSRDRSPRIYIIYSTG